MKSLSNPQDKQELLARLEAVGPATPRRWGKMTAHQMICHLSDGFRMYMGLKAVPRARVPYPPGLVKWVALWAPFPWPKGFKTVPQLDQQADGTPPQVFESDARELRALVERCALQPRDFQWQPHPHFGQMSDKEWMRLAYLHMNHHLRQFGA